MTEPTAETRPCECGHVHPESSSYYGPMESCPVNGCDCREYRPTPAPPATTGPGETEYTGEPPFFTPDGSAVTLAFVDALRDALGLKRGQSLLAEVKRMRAYIDECDRALLSQAGQIARHRAAPSSPPSGEIGAQIAALIEAERVSATASRETIQTENACAVARATLDASIAALQERAETAERALRYLNDRIAAAFA